VSGELAVELLAGLPDPSGGVFKAAEPPDASGAICSNLRLIAAVIRENSLYAGFAFATNEPVVLI